MRRFTFSLLLISTIFFTFPVSASTEEATISVFVRDNCGHCAEEKEFLTELAREFPAVTIRYYDLAEEKNKKMFDAITDEYALVKATPLTLLHGELFQGFDAPETTGEQIRNILTEKTSKNILFENIAEQREKATVFSLMNTGVCAEDINDTICKTASIERQPLYVRIPLIGIRLDVGSLPLTVLSLILGFVDGFNPCAMWVLIMFLLILSQLQSRKKMWQYASLFIFAETIMYYLILNVWFTAWDFVALDRIVTPLVGILAVGSGIYFIYKFTTYKPECTVASPEQRKSIRDRVQALAQKPLTIGVALGILGLAFSVNIFEFACSIGIPQTFTKILEFNQIGFLGRQFFMFLYILMYMIDDLVVFGIALYSVEKIALTHQYSKWSSLIGGILMIVLGLFFLIKPEYLIFN